MIENNNEEYDDIENDVEEKSDLIELIQFKKIHFCGIKLNLISKTGIKRI